MAVELQHSNAMDVWMDNVFVDADGSPTLTFRARSRETLGTTNLEAFVEETEEDFAGEANGIDRDKVKSASSADSRGSSRGSASSLGSKQNGAAQVGKHMCMSVCRFGCTVVA